MLGGAHRGPVAPTRQRRTIRLVQALLVVASAGLMMFAGYALGRVHGFDLARRGTSFDRPRSPSVVQPVVLVLISGAALAAAASLGVGRTVNLPTPARLDELVGRAERVAVERAEAAAAADGETTPTATRG